MRKRKQKFRLTTTGFRIAEKANRWGQGQEDTTTVVYDTTKLTNRHDHSDGTHVVVSAIGWADTMAYHGHLVEYYQLAL